MKNPWEGSAGFPDPGRERQVMAAWERFLQNGEVAPNTVRAPIERSWSRCLSAGVDPARVQAPTVLPAEELMTLRALHRELIEASVPIMAQAREFLSESGTILMLTDPRGIGLLLQLGRRDEAVAHYREALRLQPDDAKVRDQLRQLGAED